jgi:predicted RNase H-like nuclease (RuvC/YqgF family)
MVKFYKTKNLDSYYLEMFIEELKEEIIKLKHELRCEKNLKESAVKTVKELEERIRFLEQCLDNKEKVNKSMRDELQRFKDLWDS